MSINIMIDTFYIRNPFCLKFLTFLSKLFCLWNMMEKKLASIIVNEKNKFNFFYFTNTLILVLCVRIKATSAIAYFHLKPGVLAISIYLEGLKPHGILSRRLLVILLSISADILIHLSLGCTMVQNCTVLIRWIEWNFFFFLKKRVWENVLF